MFENLVSALKFPDRKLYPEEVASILRDHFTNFAEKLATKGHFMRQGSTMIATFAVENTVYFGRTNNSHS